MAAVVFNQEITNAGGTFTYDPVSWGGGNAIIYLYVTSPVTLAAPVNISFASNINEGATLRVLWSGGISSVDINGQAFNIDGVLANVPQWLLDNPFVGVISRVNGSSVGQLYVDIAFCNGMDGSTILLAESVGLDKLEDLTRGYIIKGDASARPVAYNAKTNLSWLIGDGTDLLSLAINGATSVVSAAISGGAIVFSFLAGSITNAAINASAAIAWSKMAALTASKVVVTSAGGVITTANQLSAALGGWATDMSAATGFSAWATGTPTTGALTDVRHVDNLSFVTANQGTYYVYFPFACTVTGINTRVTSVLGATDVGNLTIANNSGTAMTGDNLTAGVLEFAISAAFGTGYSSTLETNNTFAAGESMRLTTQKTTTGGVFSADITFTRTGLT